MYLRPGSTAAEEYMQIYVDICRRVQAHVCPKNQSLAAQAREVPPATVSSWIGSDRSRPSQQEGEEEADAAEVRAWSRVQR